MDATERMSYANFITVWRVSAVTWNTPITAKLGQVAAVVKEYISERPTSWHNSAALLVWRALAETEWE